MSTQQCHAVLQLRKGRGKGNPAPTPAIAAGVHVSFDDIKAVVDGQVPVGQPAALNTLLLTLPPRCATDTASSASTALAHGARSIADGVDNSTHGFFGFNAGRPAMPAQLPQPSPPSPAASQATTATLPLGGPASKRRRLSDDTGDGAVDDIVYGIGSEVADVIGALSSPAASTMKPATVKALVAKVIKTAKAIEKRNHLDSTSLSTLDDLNRYKANLECAGNLLTASNPKSFSIDAFVTAMFDANTQELKVHKWFVTMAFDKTQQMFADAVCSQSGINAGVWTVWHELTRYPETELHIELGVADDSDATTNIAGFRRYHDAVRNTY